MKKEYQDLYWALGNFMEDLWLSRNESINAVNRSISGDFIDKQQLILDYLHVMSTIDFDWINFAKESQLLITIENYTNLEVKNYVKSLLQDYLFPEKVITDKEIKNLNFAVEDILKNYTLNDGWMYSYDVFDELKKQEQFKDLEYYNLWKLPFIERRIEQKYIENKEIEIGYLRYNKVTAV